MTGFPLRPLVGLALLALGLLVIPVQAGEPTPKKKVDPADAPIELKIVAAKTTFPLDLDGKTPEQFRKSLQVLGKTPLPKQQSLGLKLELKNTSTKDLQVWVSGDQVVINLDLKGPGVINILAQRMFTLEFRVAKSVTVPAGKVITFPIDTLTYGFRGAERRSYWTQAGEHTLTASLKTAINPAPPAAKDARDGFGFVTVTSDPLKLTVEAK